MYSHPCIYRTEWTRGPRGQHKIPGEIKMLDALLDLKKKKKRTREGRVRGGLKFPNWREVGT